MHPVLPLFHCPLNRRMPRALRLFSLIALGGLISACATTPVNQQVAVESRTINARQDASTADPRSNDESTPLQDRDLNVQQAEFYAEAADDYEVFNNYESQAQRVLAILNSAEHYIQAGDYLQAERSLLLLADAQLDAVSSARYDVVAAYIEYSRGLFRESLRRLDRILAAPVTVAETSPQLVDALLLASFNHQALQDHAAALDVLITREQLLEGNARAETSRYIWQLIAALDEAQKQFIVSSSDSVAVINRIEQSRLGEVSSMATAPAQFDQWRQDPAESRAVAELPTWNSASARNVAILLPISSRYGKAAQALLDGIEYQHSLNQSLWRPAVRVYDIGDNPFQINQHYLRAIEDGADFIIGPLGKEQANELTSMARAASVPTLMLGGDLPLAGDALRLTMSPEWDGTTVAERAELEGFVTAAVLMPDNAKGMRTAAAFNRRWLARGGRISGVVSYSPDQFDHSTELTQLFAIQESETRFKKLQETLGVQPKFSAYRRADIDFIFMIADTETGRILRPQINFFSKSSIAVLSPSGVYNGIEDSTRNIDLNNTRFPVMPWMIRSAAVSPYAGQLNMLFAMGADAYKVAGQWRTLRSNPRHSLAGDMGDLWLDTNGEVRYQMQWAEFQDGVAQPLTPLQPLQNEARDALGLRRPQAAEKENLRQGARNYNDDNWDSGESRRKTGS
ncbi:MAG: penicillin-binding protein activator [Gammaproteobacteria bacterium]|nr:penicillin-binding protein activator [Gammaproteobacteria bacterium]